MQNDHKMIMSAIEQKLHKLHEASRQGNHSLESSLIGVPLPSPEMEGRRGFARVGTVTRGSPAAAAVSSPISPYIVPLTSLVDL